jgi:N,N'-diacetyllegionaminate synthase
MKTIIIAEIGSAWRFGDRQLGNAREAVSIARRAGADCIKFQWTSDPRKMEQRRNAPEGSYDILAWPEKWLKFIATYCEEYEIEFMCTVFLPEDVAILNPYVKRWKVASLEALDACLVQEMAATKKPIMVSLGAMTADDIGSSWLHLCLKLHCVASYPAPLHEMNLGTISYSVNEHPSYVTHGLSDHSGDELTGALAVACGASIIEVHFMLDYTPKDNPDYEHSHTPGGLKYYIINIRKAELMLGDGVKKVEPSEQWALKHKVRT